MNGRLSERPSAVKYSGLPSRRWRKALLSLPSTVNVAASTGPVLASGPFFQVCSTTTLKRSLASRSESKSMSYLNISSVSWRSCALPRPCLRAEANSESPTVPVSTTVRVVTSCGTARSRKASPLNSSSTGSSPMPGAASMRIARTEPSAGRLKLSAVPGRSLRSAGLIFGCCITVCSWL